MSLSPETSHRPASRPGPDARSAEDWRGAYEALLQSLVETAVRLSAAEADRDRLAVQLDAVYRSSSWRLGRPLRAAGSLLRRLRSGAPLHPPGRRPTDGTP